MKYEEAKAMCHVRSGIYRVGDPTKIYTKEDAERAPFPELCIDRIGMIVPKVYWKNHTIALDLRVPDKDKMYDDWEEYDPRDHEECSAYNEMPA